MDSNSLPRWVEIYESLMNKFKVTADHILKLSSDERAKLISRTDEFREKFVLDIVGEESIEEARTWIKNLLKQLEEVKKELKLRGVTLTRELKSFMEDPLLHLKKKVFIYTFQLFSGNISLYEFASRASAAVRTSLRTNMRSLYQTWVFLALLKKITEGGRLVYPEHGYLYLERSAKQKTGIIPPNCIAKSVDGRTLSFFIEAPRPIAWEDTSDLKRIWGLYVALRPDFLVYGGSVMNIVDLNNSPPIKRPNIIVECKELKDWYKRARDLRGWWSKAISAEEWRALWLRGLIEGLAEAIGVRAKGDFKRKEERKGLRVKEYKLVQIYKKVYNPDLMVLITRTEIPSDIKREIENYGLEVYDNISFEDSKLSDVAEELLRYGKKEEIGLTEVLYEILGKRYDKISKESLNKALALLVRKHKNEFLELLHEVS